jgi:hypothetical protein
MPGGRATQWHRMVLEESFLKVFVGDPGIPVVAG